MIQPAQTTNEPTTEETVDFVPLKDFEDDYEILSQYPFTIRKKSNHRVLKESIIYEGYAIVNLSARPYRKHRLIANQFIPNPDNFPQVDHINKQRNDYHLSNLRWVSSSKNCENKSSHKGVQYEFIDDIPNEAIVIDWYETRTERREFETNKYYYYHDEETNEDKFYGKITDKLYKILYININKSGNEFVNLQDINNRLVALMIDKFKFQHDL